MANGAVFLSRGLGVSSRCYSRLASRNGNRTLQHYEPSPKSTDLAPMVEEVNHLWTLRASFSDEDVKISLVNDPSFRGTCGVIMKKLRYMRPEQVRSLAHLVFGINLPTNIGITKGVLQMLRVHINEYDARQLSDLYFLLKSAFERDLEDGSRPPNPTLEALLAAIPKALEITIMAKKIDPRPESLLLILRSSTSGCIDINAVRFLLQIISNKLRYMNTPQLYNLIGILSRPHIKSNLDSIGRPLVNRILEDCQSRVIESFKLPKTSNA